MSAPVEARPSDTVSTAAPRAPAKEIALDNEPKTARPPIPAPSLSRSLSRSFGYLAGSVVLWLTYGLSMNIVTVNASQIQGSLGATLTETNWLTAAYMAPNVSLALLLMKVRTQFGIRRFCEYSLGIFLVASLLHLFVHDLWTALPVRFLAGVAATPLSAIGFFYMLEAFPPARKMSWGLSLALSCSMAAPWIARIISRELLDLDQWHQLYVMEIGLALLALAIIYLLPLAPVPHAKVLHWRDLITYPLIAVGFGLVAVVLVLGRHYWWFEAPWIGVCLAIAAIAIACAAGIEIKRDIPLIDLRWLMSPDMIRFTLTLLALRIVLSEQTAGATGLFQMLGLLNEQSRALHTVILMAGFAGGMMCGALLNLNRVRVFLCLALACIMIGAYMDSSATNLTRPQEMYFSQGLIAFGSGLFLPSAVLAGFTKSTQRGPHLLTSFVVVFLFTQSIGGLIGSAIFSTFVTVREKFHSSHLVEHMVLSNPLLGERIRQLSGAYDKVLTDPQLLNAEGLESLARQVTREANVLAYNDAFSAIAVIAAVALSCILLFGGYRTIRARLSVPRVAPSLNPSS